MAQHNEAPIRVGLLGAGTVGSQTARLLVEQRDELSQRIGRDIELVGVACLDPDEVDFPWIDRSLLTSDTMAVATNADIVVELIGGLEPARTFVLAAIESGASVVTANKALLAKYGPEIYQAAEAKGVDIYFEAAVGGAIPIVRPLRESLVGDKVTSMLGIVNGTTNYILDEMTTKGLDFDVALKDAQAKGYAEADPTGDIEGHDAANKAAIMATLGFHANVGPPPPPWSATWSLWPATSPKAAPARPSRCTTTCPRPRSKPPRPRSPCGSSSMTSRACSPPSRRNSPSAAYRSTA